MTDGQPLKERRKAEKAELFQKGRDRAGIIRRKRKDMLTEEVRFGSVLMQKPFFLLRLAEIPGTLLCASSNPLHSFIEEYLSSTEGSFSCKWGFTPIMGRMLVDKALMV